MSNWPPTSSIDSARLTLREIEVLGLIARGCTYARIAVQLGISAHTVATHIKSAYRKLNVHSAGAAVMRAIELRLLTVGSG
jgi:DNA-binding CsgD family transcriptional regulator